MKFGHVDLVPFDIVLQVLPAHLERAGGRHDFSVVLLQRVADFPALERAHGAVKGIRLAVRISGFLFRLVFQLLGYISA